MKEKKLAVIIVSCAVLYSLIILVLVLLFAYARYVLIYKSPLDYEDSMWISEDGKISFVSNGSTGKGELKTSDGVLSFEISNSLDGGLYLYPPEEINEAFEIWWWQYYGDNKFTATVEKSSYFPVGTVITFYRIDLPMENSA